MKKIFTIILITYICLCVLDVAMENTPYAVGHLWQYSIFNIFK